MSLPSSAPRYRSLGSADRPDFNPYRSDYIAQPESNYALIMPETEEPEDIGRFVRKWTHLVADKEFVVLNTGAHWGGMSASVCSTSSFASCTDLLARSFPSSP